MALYSYKKEPIKIVSPERHSVVEIKRKSHKNITLWDILQGFWNDTKLLMLHSKVAGFFIPALLILFGISIIYRQLWPEFEEYVKFNTGYYDSSSVALVAGDYIERAKYLSDPGAEYFKQLTDEADLTHALQPDTVSSSYQGNFKISIPSLDLYGLNVTANVESGVKEAYEASLLKGLAHFKGTGLPISNINNNIVIYGHSASRNYYEETHDIVAAFSRLNQIKVGDIVEVEIEGKKYNFRISRSKIVEPNDVSIVTGTANQRTLTLFTCYPPGNRTYRFVAIAKAVED